MAKKKEKQEKQEKQEKKEGFLKEIMAVSGHPGLYRFIAKAKNGVIVESIETGRRMQAFSTMKISGLEDISVYTGDSETSLQDVLKLIFEKEGGGETISHKSEPEKLGSYFAEVLPAYDRERVYTSDIRKILCWYNILLKQDVLKFEGQAGGDENNSGGDSGSHADAGGN